MTVTMHKSGIPEENLPRKKRRIEEVLEKTPEVASSGREVPQDLTMRSSFKRATDNVLTPVSRKHRESDKGGKKDSKNESTLVNTLVAKAMKIWYDEDVPGVNMLNLMNSPIKNSPINLSLSKSIAATKGFALDFDIPPNGTKSPRNKSPKDLRMTGGMPLGEITNPNMRGMLCPPDVLTAHAQFFHEMALRESLAQQAALAQSLPVSENTNSTNNSTTGHPYMKLKAMLHKKYANSLNESVDSGTVSSPELPPAAKRCRVEPVDTPNSSRRGSVDSESLSPVIDSSVVETPNGERLYRCNVCFKAFTFSTNLTRHQRNIHGKPYRRRTKEMVNKPTSADDVNTSGSPALSPVPLIVEAPAVLAQTGQTEAASEVLQFKAPTVRTDIKSDSDNTLQISSPSVQGVSMYDSMSSADEDDSMQDSTIPKPDSYDGTVHDKTSLLSELVMALQEAPANKDICEDVLSTHGSTDRQDEQTEDDEDEEDRLVIAEEETWQHNQVDSVAQETKFQVILGKHSVPGSPQSPTSPTQLPTAANPPQLPTPVNLPQLPTPANLPQLPNPPQLPTPVNPPQLPSPANSTQLPNPPQLPTPANSTQPPNLPQLPTPAKSNPPQLPTPANPPKLPTPVMPPMTTPPELTHMWPKQDADNQWRFKCFECGVAFPFWKDLSKHLREVHGVGMKEGGMTRPQEEHSCKLCGRIFAAAPNLRRHIKNVHVKKQHNSIGK